MIAAASFGVRAALNWRPRLEKALALFSTFRSVISALNDIFRPARPIPRDVASPQLPSSVPAFPPPRHSIKSSATADYVRKSTMTVSGVNTLCSLDNRRPSCHVERVVSEKYETLRALLEDFGSCLVAYSGGVDSVFLAYVARDVLGEKSLAVIADSASLPRRELEEALEIAEEFQIPVRVVHTQEIQNPNYPANPSNRCDFCND